MTSIGLRQRCSSCPPPASTLPPQSRHGSSQTAPPDRSSPADRPSQKSPQAACPHQKIRVVPSPHLCDSCPHQSDSHKLAKAAIFQGALASSRSRVASNVRLVSKSCVSTFAAASAGEKRGGFRGH